MGAVLAATDLVVSRAGASSLAEISARCIPAILIPFPFCDRRSSNSKCKKSMLKEALHFLSQMIRLKHRNFSNSVLGL